MTDSPATLDASRDVCLVVRRAATFMTSSNTEEGFARAMERFILRRPAHEIENNRRPRHLSVPLGSDQ
jgi:hypothetical protein